MKFKPDYCECPGHILCEHIQDDETAIKRIFESGITLEVYYGILLATTQITPKIAEQLHQATGIQASFWLSSQRLYNDFLLSKHSPPV